MYRRNQMFDKNLMDQFRIVNDPSDQLKNAWYIFVSKLLPIVNETWNKLLKENYLTQKADLYANTTVSDEALVRWVIHCKMDKIMAQPEQDGLSDIGKKGKKSGQHDSIAKKGLYVDEYNKVLASFQTDVTHVKQRWNDLFWESMEIKHPTKFSERPEKRAKLNNDEDDFPDVDPNL